MWGTPVAAAIVTGACTFSSAGGSGTGSAEGGATSSSGTEGADGADGATSQASQGSADATSQSASAGDTATADTGDTATSSPPVTTTMHADSGTSAGSDTGASFDCESDDSFTELQTVLDATMVDPPWQTQPSWAGLPGDPTVAWVDQNGDGGLTFAFDVPCDRTYYLWGLTWDQVHGVNNCSGITNADALMVSVDGGPEIQWSYGCQGCANADSVWTWTIVHEYMASGCVTALWPVALTAGTHTVRFRGFENGSFNPAENPNVAAIAAVALGDDPAWTPVWP